MVTERKSLAELKELRLTHLSHVQLGAVYKHKKSGAYYVPKDVVLNESDLEVHVVYSPMTTNSVVFSRPFNEWHNGYEKHVVNSRIVR
jgi:hypothetical protein